MQHLMNRRSFAMYPFCAWLCNYCLLYVWLLLRNFFHTHFFQVNFYKLSHLNIHLKWIFFSAWFLFIFLSYDIFWSAFHVPPRLFLPFLKRSNYTASVAALCCQCCRKKRYMAYQNLQLALWPFTKDHSYWRKRHDRKKIPEPITALTFIVNLCISQNDGLLSSLMSFYNM